MTTQQIQNLLQYLGYYTIQVDGISGPGTTAAIEAFQRDFGGLVVDGIAGPATQKALKHAVAYGMEKNTDTDKPIGSQAGNEQTGSDFPGCPNFTRAEFACKCGCGFDDVSPTLVKKCQTVRDHFCAAFVPTSSCRCKTHNARVGGVYNSRHLRCADGTAHAVDFYIAGHSSAEVDAFVATIPGIAYHYIIKENGRNTNCVHMDIGP